ncbi:hypothetical protein MD484_g7188, partial [Candolleomyces efflorescens]
MNTTIVEAHSSSPQLYTLGDLVAMLASAGVRLERPVDPSVLPNNSVAIAVIGEAGDAIEEHQWSVMHSGASDMLLAGPVANIPIPEMIQALVNIRAAKANEVEPARRARYSGGFTCIGCGHFNLLRSSHEVPSSERWYSVVVGTEVGVFQGSTVATSHTLNVKGAALEGFNTREEAEAAFERAKAAGAVKKVIAGETVNVV